MNKKKKAFHNSINRRDFLKKKILGGFVFTLGIPFYPFRDFFQKPGTDAIFKGFSTSSEKMNWEEIRNQFLIPSDKVFLNTASLGPSPKTVIQKVSSTLEELAGKARDGRWLQKGVRSKIAEFLSAETEEIAITRNATEGINIVARSLPLNAGDEVILSTHEHVGGAMPWLALQKDRGIVIKLVDLNLDGIGNLEKIEQSISPKTKVIFLSHLTCTTGLILPIKEIVDLCREKGIYSCIDGAQAVGMIPINLKELDPDFYVGSGHKWLFGPKGTGVLYMNKNVIADCKPTFVGAYSDQKFDLNALSLEYRQTASREEYGTRNMPITAGLGEAVDFINAIGMEQIQKLSHELFDQFYHGLLKIQGVDLLTPKTDGMHASILTFKVKGKDSLTIRNRLSKEKSITVRHIYENQIDGIRVSLSIFNSKEEVDQTLKAIKEIVNS